MTTSLNEVRTKVRIAGQALAATWTDYPLIIEYDNFELVNFETQQNPFLRILFRPMGGNQADLAKRPIHRVPAMLTIEAWDKKGKGNARMDKLLSHFYPSFQMTDRHMPLRTFAAQLFNREPGKGWEVTFASIPAWYDSFPT